ncbi:MAG: thiamine pyrophosphate-binding protein [Rhodoferax sp.]|jgi:acetolactate synthase-1/2/3 large subunit|nr:thiamine pyrophosphate-binding protein [Rhodoferax sp.]
MRTVPVYQVLAEDLKALGVDTVFGLMSDCICQLFSTLDAMGVRMVGARHETNAVMMAMGYAAATGKLGVALVGRGPAMANAMHGTISVAKSAMPVLIISGDAPIGRGVVNGLGPDLKAFPAATVVRACGIPTFQPSSADAARQSLADAVAETSLGRASVLLLPTDVQVGYTTVADGPSPVKLSPVPAPQRARQSAIDTAVSVLSRARRPVIVAGVGAHRAGAREAIEALADRTGALLVNALKAKDLFRGNPYDMGILGSSSTSVARRYIEQADCVLAIGVALNSLTMSSGSALPPVPLIHVDAVRTNINRWWPADVGVVGDARLVAEQLTQALPERTAEEKPWHTDKVRAELAAFQHTMDFQPAHTASTIDPRILTLELSRMLPENRHIVFDGGNFMANWAYFSVPGPSHFTHSLDSGSVGLGLGTAIGVKRGQPDRTVMLMIGDGGMLMSMGEIETIIREDLPMVVVVMNDAAYGAEVHILRGQNLPPAKAEFFDVEFAPMAEPLGFDCHTVRSVADLKKLEPLLANPDGPILIDCKINVEVIAPFLTEFIHKDTGPKR